MVSQEGQKQFKKKKKNYYDLIKKWVLHIKTTVYTIMFYEDFLIKILIISRFMISKVWKKKTCTPFVFFFFFVQKLSTLF